MIPTPPPRYASALLSADGPSNDSAPADVTTLPLRVSWNPPRALRSTIVEASVGSAPAGWTELAGTYEILQCFLLHNYLIVFLFLMFNNGSAPESGTVISRTQAPCMERGRPFRQCRRGLRARATQQTLSKSSEMEVLLIPRAGAGVVLNVFLVPSPPTTRPPPRWRFTQTRTFRLQ